MKPHEKSGDVMATTTSRTNAAPGGDRAPARSTTWSAGARWARLAALPLACVACGSSGNGEAASETCSDAATLCTWAGNGEAAFDQDHHPLLESSFYWPIDMTFTSEGDAYILDWNNHAVRHVDEDGTLSTVIGSGFVGDGPPDLSDLQPPGALGTEIDLNHPTQLVELPTGKLLLVSWHNHKLREYDPETGLAVVTCGGAAGYKGDGEAARGAQLNQPTQVLLDDDGSLYVLDMRNQVVRKIDPDGVIDTVAGTPGEAGYEGDGDSPMAAKFRFPSGSNPPPGGALALDGDGRLYVSDTLNHVIRRIDFESDEITTIAGTGESGFSGDDGPATEAQMNNPRDLQMNGDRSVLYVADELNHRIRAFDVESGIMTTVAGNGDAGYDGEGDAPTETALNRPGGLALDADGLLYVMDTYNHRIRVFDPEKATNDD